MGFNTVNFGLETSDIIGLTPDQRTAVEFQLVFSVSNRGSQLYDNLRYPRFQNFFGYAQIMSGAFVINEVQLQYLNQEILHWRDETFGINETVGCYIKALGAGLAPPVIVITNTVLTRQRITGIRFRLMPTVIANVSLTWETATAKCSGNILSPDPLQGKPPAPNNSNSGSGSRPSGQGGDNEDPSNNDGNNAPNDGVPDAPQATEPLGPIPGQWFVVYSGFNAGCNGTYSARRYLLPGCTNGRITPIESGKADSPCGQGSYDADVSYNGGFLFRASAVTSQVFDFVAE